MRKIFFVSILSLGMVIAGCSSSPKGESSSKRDVAGQSYGHQLVCKGMGLYLLAEEKTPGDIYYTGVLSESRGRPEYKFAGKGESVGGRTSIPVNDRFNIWIDGNRVRYVGFNVNVNLSVDGGEAVRCSVVSGE